MYFVEEYQVVCILKHIITYYALFSLFVQININNYWLQPEGVEEGIVWSILLDPQGIYLDLLIFGSVCVLLYHH